MPLLGTPTADLALSWGPGNAWGQTTVDLVLTAEADVGLVVDIHRLVQDVTRWLYTPPGANPFDPTYGNPMFAFLGPPYSPQTVNYAGIVAAAEEQFLADQANAYRAGWVADDSLVDHFEGLQVAPTPDGLGLVITLTVVARTGASAPVSATLA